MTESTFQQPTAQQLEGFVQGDPVLRDEVIHLLLPQLHRWAVQKYFNLPQDEVQSVVNGVLAEACRNHARFDPQKAKITTYLIGLIEPRMATLYQATKKKAEFEELFSDRRENLPHRAYNLSNAAEVDNQLVRARFLEKVRGRLDETEREVLELMLQGEKSQEEYLSIIGHHVSVTDPASEVKNFKERLKRKLRSIARELGYGKHDLLDE